MYKTSTRKSISLLGKRLYSQASKDSFQTTTLSNGIRVATTSLPSHFSALGLYLGAGSRYENDINLKGCTHMMDRLSFKSTENIDGRTMAETLELLGGNYQCTSSRETIMYQASVFNQDVDKMLNLMAETVRYPKITESELNEQKSIVQYEVDEVWLKPELIMPELLHVTAYSNKTLGNQSLCPIELLPSLTKERLLIYRDKFFIPKNTVAAFVGVPHEMAIKYVENHFGDWKSSNSLVKQEPAHYTGGEMCIPTGPVYGGLPELYHIQLGFEGLPIDHPDICALATLQTLLGGGGSFSAGGPGKGIFGISISCIPEAASQAVEVIAQQLHNTFANDRLKLTNEEVERAKNQLKSSLLMNLESKLVELEDMGRQIQAQGKKIPLTEIIAKIEALTPEDIRRVAETVFTGKVKNIGNGTGKATVVMQGNRESFGDVETLLRHYGLGNYPKLEQPLKFQKKNRFF